jgi:hypothetical protein
MGQGAAGAAGMAAALDRLVRASPRVCAVLATSPLPTALATRLVSPDAVLRKTVLRVRSFGDQGCAPEMHVRTLRRGKVRWRQILTALFASAPDARQFVGGHPALTAAVAAAAEADPAVLVQEMARTLSDALRAAAAVAKA